MTFKATNPRGDTSVNRVRFVDRDTIEAGFRLTDQAGTVLIDAAGTSKRRKQAW